MDYLVNKKKDYAGNLRDEIDTLRGRYAFPVFTPTAASNDYITVPSNKQFFMDVIEVYNPTNNSVSFTVKDDNGNDLSLTYTVNGGEYKVIKFYHGPLQGNIHFVPATYSTLVFKVSGYMDEAN